MSQKNKVEIQVSVIGEDIAAAKIEAMTNAARHMADQAARAVDLLTRAVELAQTLAQTKIDIAPPCAAKPVAAKPAKKPAAKRPAPMPWDKPAIVRKPVIVEKPTGAKVVKAEIVRKPIATAKPKRVRPPRTEAQKARRRELAAHKRALAAAQSIAKIVNSARKAK